MAIAGLLPLDQRVSVATGNDPVDTHIGWRRAGL
jgi:hypothetical protein